MILVPFRSGSGPVGKKPFQSGPNRDGGKTPFQLVPVGEMMEGTPIGWSKEAGTWLLGSIKPILQILF